MSSVVEAAGILTDKPAASREENEGENGTHLLAFRLPLDAQGLTSCSLRPTSKGEHECRTGRPAEPLRQPPVRGGSYAAEEEIEPLPL